MPEVAQKIVDDLRSDYSSFYDSGGSIGRRYRRQDEIGTPLCVTIDFDSLEDNSVTVRNRDSMMQERVNIESLYSYLLKPDNIFEKSLVNDFEFSFFEV